MRAVALRAVVGLGLLCSGGCDSEYDQNEKQRRELLRQRQELQAVLDQNKIPPAQLSAEQRTFYGKIDRQIRSIDEQIETLNQPASVEWQ